MRKVATTALGAACALLLGSAVAVPQSRVIGAERAAAGSDGETLGFALVEFLPTMIEKPNCPKGINQNMEAFLLAKETPEERARLKTPAGERELQQKAWFIPSGEMKGKQVCHFPAALANVTPPHILVAGTDPIPGLDLDGLGTLTKPTASACPHENFSDGNGRVNVDNQVYRIDGCIDSKRFGGVARSSAIAEVVNGSQSIVVFVSGVNDRRNDPDVQVLISRSNDPTPFSLAGNPLPFASLTVASDPKFQAQVRGKIVDGVLTTEPADMVLWTPQVITKTEQAFRQARIQLKIRPDGSAEGVLAGYRPIEDYYYNVYAKRGHRLAGLTQTTSNYMCSSLWRALHEHADGLRNPKTGKCEGISSALMLKALPAYVFKP